MTINSKFQLEDIVYLITDKSQTPFMVTAIFIRFDQISYEISSGFEDLQVFPQQISKEEDILKKLT